MRLMQHSRPLHLPPLGLSFKHHRLSIDNARSTVDPTLPTSVAAPAWASLPTPPMSGSPPPEPRTEPPQLAGRRRKRSQTPPASTAVAAAVTLSSPATPFQQTATRSSAQTRGGDSIGEIATRPVPFAPSYPPLLSFSSPSTSLPSIPVAGSEQRRFGPSPISPRATRKTKAHVASACINCKNKHLRCDDARPCRRCVQSGKEVRAVPVLFTTRVSTLIVYRIAVWTSSTKGEAGRP